MITVTTGCFFNLESFILISGISGFLFFAIASAYSKTRKLIFQGIKTIYLISRALLSILCVQDTTLKALLKVIEKNLLLKLESGFSCYESQKGA